MRWLVRRVLAMWLMLVIVCIAGIVAGRLDPTHNTLQRFGFSLCDGEVCFRGIKADTELRIARNLLPQAVERDGSLKLPVNSEIMLDIIIYDPKSYGNIVMPTQISAYDPSGTLIFPVTVGDVIAQYGAPCRIDVSFSSNEEFFVYPTTLMVVAYSIYGQNAGLWGARLNPDSPVGRLYLVKTGSYGKCDDSVSETGGIWQGFTSIAVYRDRFKRAVDQKQP